AMHAGRTPESFPAADEDYFKDMERGQKLSVNEVKGRNNWIVWSGGNDRFWDGIGTKSVGTLDFVKTLSSYPGRKPDGEPWLKASRDNRWHYLGLVNEPCFEKATGPDPKRYNLWLDKRRQSPDCPPDPFEDEQRYPGVAAGARGKNLPVGSYYGWASGIVGLRLFPNPAFDEAAAKRWNADRYYRDPTYYFSKELVKPYRVGMTCGFCHVGPNPLRPPVDPENPKWENLSSNVGAQYFWIDRIFTWESDPSSFAFQLFHTSRPGALDTSLVSTDYINNPRTMNAIYGLGSRLELAKRWGKERLAGGGLDNAQFNDYVKSGPLTAFFARPDSVLTPRVLKDGSDSVGALGALNRVFLNIGLFSEEWERHFNPLVGGKPISPIEIKVARRNSAYWQATEAQTLNLAAFFLASTAPHHLKDAPGGAAYLSADTGQLTRGKEIFADRCARCHSSKIPAPAPGVDDAGGCSGPGYLDCWNRYWAWTKTGEFKQKMRQIVLAADFLDGNYLSTELRVPVTLLETNACSPLATNAIAGNVWDNFSSKTYKTLPSVGTITVHDPFTGAARPYRMPGGGRGYTRPASLISLWSTAPFLQNNSVGKFNPEPSVEGRMESFQNSIEQMLWPEKRDKDRLLGDKIEGPSHIDRTTAPSYLRVPEGYLPAILRHRELAKRVTPAIIGEGGIEIGPIPAGTPVNLLSNVDLVPDHPTLEERTQHGRNLVKLVDALVKVKIALAQLPQGASEEERGRAFAPLAGPLLALSKCPDFVVNRGHYFGTSLFKEEPGLSDDEKRALIEFLKTF
ncbi:MAG: cytochrome c, partial [Acidobacteriota bacterium]|nr:cytochrome c [Acidobacteriota bacterium]